MRIFDTEALTTPIPARASRPTRLFVIEDSDVVQALWRTVAANIP